MFFVFINPYTRVMYNIKAGDASGILPGKTGMRTKAGLRTQITPQKMMGMRTKFFKECAQ